MKTNSILSLKHISLNFGGIIALNDVSFSINEREIFAIIGPNGAGKTSILNCISGFYSPQKGQIIFKDDVISKLPPHKIAKKGIGRTFQNIALYSGMSTVENLMAGRHAAMKQNFLTGGLFYGPGLNEEIKHRAVVEEIIDFLEITALRNKPVGTLPYGMRKRVDLGRALALDPKVLLLDEPMAGMNVEEKEDMARFIIDIYETLHIPIIIVEHDMGLVMDISDRVYVLEFGQEIASGPPSEIVSNPQVIDAYLGREEANFAAREKDEK